MPAYCVAMHETQLPPHDEMLQAFLASDAAYEGVFLTAVRTTGIFCRPSCPARKPKPENVEFFSSAKDALFSGYRPCKRCRPMQANGDAPTWLNDLLAAMEADPNRRWRDADIRELGLHPDRVRRWFKQHHRMTFHAYARARRLGRALTRIREGDAVTPVALDSGYESLSGFNDAFRQWFGAPAGEARQGSVLLARRIVTPLGPMLAVANEQGLCLLEFSDRRMLERQINILRRRLQCRLTPGDNAVLEHTAREVAAYFTGRLSTFTVPLVTPGTEFQNQVWRALRDIPAGTTLSYSDLAAKLGRPSAARAVARANGDNRIAIIIPCHRVIAADGTLAGYGGGVWRKQRLLELERGADARTRTP